MGALHFFLDDDDNYVVIIWASILKVPFVP